LLAGSTNVTKFLLSKGIPVDIDYGSGTALLQAAINEQDKTEDFVGSPRKCIYSPYVYYFIFSRANLDR
jgi:hypothetical protein